MDSFTFSEAGMWAARLVILFFAIIVHEVSHGYVAYLLGDPTAKRAGRLTLNPLKHIDLWGTVIMPILLLVLSGGSFSFGYAKPVPFDPSYFKNRKLGTALVGAAGPGINIILAIITGLAVRFLVPSVTLAATTPASIALQLCFYAASVNLMLAFFNLIPIPPLDGSRIVAWLLPRKAERAYEKLEPYGFVIIIAVTYFLPKVLDAYLNVTMYPVLQLLTGFSLS